MRAALPGAPLERRAGRGKPEGWSAWMPASFSPAQDVLSTNPVARTRTFRAGEGMDARVEATQEQLPDARKARKRGGLSLGLLSLWPHKEKVTRLPKADESSCSARWIHRRHDG